jgi:hypothetical protein
VSNGLRLPNGQTTQTFDLVGTANTYTTNISTPANTPLGFQTAKVTAYNRCGGIAATDVFQIVVGKPDMSGIEAELGFSRACLVAGGGQQMYVYGLPYPATPAGATDCDWVISPNPQYFSIAKSAGRIEASIIAAYNTPPGLYDIRAYPKNVCGRANPNDPLIGLFMVAGQLGTCGSGGGSTLTLNLTPNPAQDELNVEFSDNLESSNNQVELRIYNRMGNLVLEEKNIPNKTKLNTSKLPKGIYYLHFISTVGVIQRRIIIDK